MEWSTFLTVIAVLYLGYYIVVFIMDTRGSSVKVKDVDDHMYSMDDFNENEEEPVQVRGDEPSKKKVMAES